MMSLWKLHDAVTIAAEGSFPALHGVIAYIDGDRIGVRLTGDSQGMGDHSGSVDGIDYFDCPLNSGVLTTAAKISKRQLTSSEEQQLRRELLPRISSPPPSSIPLSGLSPAALARMAQLQKQMQAEKAVTPQASKNLIPQLHKNPASHNKQETGELKEPREPPTLAEEEKEKPLSRLELLRKRKEEIRLKKLALQEKVQDKKDKQQQQQQQEEEQTVTEPQTIKNKVEEVAPTTTKSQQNHPSSPAIQEPPQKQQKQERQKSQDSLARLWIRELRHESPPAAARYDEEDEDEDDKSEQAQESPKLPDVEPDSNDMGYHQMIASSSGPLSRLQQLRQKKRLLEALPASIATTVPAPDIEDIPSMIRQEPSGNNHSWSTTTPPLGLASIAMASAAFLARGSEDNDDASNSTLSTQMGEMELEDDNDDHYPAVPTESFQESVTITSSHSQATQEEEAEHKTTHKRRRVLGLGFLPTNRRQQKRRDTGRGKEEHQ